VQYTHCYRKLRIQAAGDGRIQEMFYNGWTHDHYVTNLFVFAPDGTIIAAVLNAPGSMHDSELATVGNIYNKLATVQNLLQAK
jgi:hypothetical protein